MVRLRILLLLAGIAACAPGPPAPSGPADTAAAVASDMGAAIEADGRGGAALGIFTGDGLALTRGFGIADMESGAGVTANHVFRIGSITKPVTAMAFLHLVHQGRVGLGDPVASLVPELDRVRNPFPGLPGPSLIQLGTMTAGLAREPDNLPVYLEGAPGDWLETALRALDETSFTHPPGTRYQYSNIGYAILGAAVERAAEAPFLSHVRENLLAPLGMDSTWFRPVAEIEDRIATGYAVADDGSLDGETPLREHRGRGYKVPNGALYSTVSDLHTFLRFLIGDEDPEFESVLPVEVRRENRTRAFARGDLSFGYGFGFMARRLAAPDGIGFTAYGHGGSVAGYRAAAWIEPDTGAAVVVLRNVSGGPSPGDLALAALSRMVGAIRAQSGP